MNKQKYHDIGCFLVSTFETFSEQPWDILRKRINKEFGNQKWPALAKFLVKHQYLIFSGKYKPSTIPQSKNRLVKVYMINPA